MDEYTRREDRLPNEIVETYRRGERLPGERVSVYRRPLPGTAAAPQAAPAKTAFAEASPSGRRRRRRRAVRRRRGLLIFLSCFAVVALLAGISALLERPEEKSKDHFEQYYDEAPEAEDLRRVTIPAYPTGQGVELAVSQEHPAEPLTAQEIYRTVNPAVVLVVVQVGEQKFSSGTGVIFREDGYLLTNYHVVEGGSACQVVLSTGVGYEACYVGGDAVHDLAVLKIEAQGLPVAEFGDADQLIVGDPVYAIGNPLGMELRGTMTDGIVSAIDRDVEVDGRIMNLIQTNAALNSGNSGGPLISQYGQVVGINVIKMTSRSSNVEGLGFAIPSTAAQRIATDLLTWGETKPEPLLGVTVLQEGQQVTQTLRGLEVIEVTPGGAADRAGIREGDYLLRADGEELLASRDLLRVRRRLYVGDQLPILLWRDGETLEVILDLREGIE